MFKLQWLVETLACLTFCIGDNVSYDSNAIIIKGERRIIFSDSIHYPRSTEAIWPDLIQKVKDRRFDATQTYSFWDRHEPQRRKYDFSGR
ncbi:hypothetical protein IC582_021871 [Cucumis melo]